MSPGRPGALHRATLRGPEGPGEKHQLPPPKIIQEMTHREPHTTPHLKFLRMPHSKLHRCYGCFSGASCREGQDGPRMGTLGFPKAALVFAADPVAHWADTLPRLRGDGGKRSSHPHTTPKGPRL